MAKSRCPILIFLPSPACFSQHIFADYYLFAVNPFKEKVMTTAISRLSGKSDLARKILSLSSSDLSHEKIVVEVVLHIQKATDIEAVGLRIADDLDYPYYFTNGFGEDFVRKEMHLCARDNANEIIRDSSGNPTLECMCGNIIYGRADCSKPFFTQGGSFWSNCTTDLLASTSDEDRLTRTRNRCNGEGYESVALMPIKTEKKIFGLLQLNDRRKNMFTLEDICFFEGIAGMIGILFAAIKAKENLAAKTDDVIRLANVRLLALEKIGDQLKEKKDIPAYNFILTKLNGLLDEIESMTGTLPICATCKKIRDTTQHWQQIEGYVMNRTKANFTHTICPDCYDKWRKEEGF